MKRSIALTALIVSITACQQEPAPAAAVAEPAPISEADAGKIADATVAAWTSGDAARIKALYAPSITGFDFSTGPLATDQATWNKTQDAFAAVKIDGSVQKERKIQILDADTFVVSGTWDVTSTANPAANGTVRCTVVYEKDAEGKWPIVNEHCSAVPKA